MTPVIYNDSTEAMYVFLEIQMPECSGSTGDFAADSTSDSTEDSTVELPLYTFEVNPEWVLVESGGFFS